MKIIKRDGREEEFNQNKIIDAILAAFKDVDGDVDDYAYTKAGNIADYIKDEARPLTVEEIQDLVENGLMSTKRKDVARAYIRYRYKKEVAREQKDDFIRAFESKLMATDVENSNANMDERSFGGRIGSAASFADKDYAINHMWSPLMKKNHLGNMIYVHDADHYAVGDHNCLSCPIDKLLAEGFKVRQVDIRPAGSLSTAMQLVAVIFQVQSLCQFGGVSATHIDWSMVPYVRKSFAKHYKTGLKYFENKNEDEIDYEIENMLINILDNSIENREWKAYSQKSYDYAMDMLKKEAAQASEALFHNLNSLQSRSGSQLPFSSINFGSCTLPEGRLVIRALLETSIDGLGKFHKTPIFPCSIFQLGKGINREPGDPNYDLYQLALKSTSLRLYPNYANLDWSNNAGYDPDDPKTYFSTMGCRTSNGPDINAEEGTNPQTKDGRGNICPVTIILPTLAMMAKEKAVAENNDNTIEVFFEILDQKIYEAKDMLLERFEWICSQSPASAQFMYENGTMLGYKPEEGIRSALKHGTLVAGQLGLAECLQILIGRDHTTPEGMELAKRIEQLFKDKCAEFKQQYHLNFGVYYTPAESLCYTAMNRFKEKYGIIENVSDKEWFTNSMHVPVSYRLSPFDKIDIESQLTGYSNAGCITYVELDASCKNNLKALEQIVNYAMDKDIPYFAINILVDECNDCGFSGEMNDTCPQCSGHHVTHLRRVTGYLTGDYQTAFNDGKIAETEHRVRHTGYLE